MPRIVDKLSADLIQRLAASGSQCYEYKPLLCSGVVKKRNVENRFRLSQALPKVTATPAVCFDLFSKNSKKVKKVKKSSIKDKKSCKSGWTSQPNGAQGRAEGGPEVVSIDLRDTTAIAIARKPNLKPDFCLKLELVWCQNWTQNLSLSFDFK